MKIALIAHDELKDTMVNFCIAYEGILKEHVLFSTGTTGKRIEAATELKIDKVKSGPLGGDQQIGALIAQDELDLVIFLRDPLTSQPHEPDIQALIRLCDVYKIPVATNIATGELLVKAMERGEFSWRLYKKS
ncbi:methylglyoxal synthase [Anaeromicrobium sediminis]|uniref:Methylglyoxal synthase n=1 Tax=Anaeromicrobium sediminis TaxID=1478221 RepID=A0A267MR33_9FIRM|nr:methylglyoxal synthase [Anaeromicrobium sediminis]PAB61368.1 methylglyoxal synthase [Anaeromicrobium sediminis]